MWEVGGLAGVTSHPIEINRQSAELEQQDAADQLKRPRIGAPQAFPANKGMFYSGSHSCCDSSVLLSIPATSSPHRYATSLTLL